MKAYLIIVLATISISIFSISIVKKINLKQNCTGYLKRAADANTVETALLEITKATKYLETENLTSGYTSIFWRTPDEDIAFWYLNLKASEKELSILNGGSNSLEKTNALMKLRETLMDEGDKGEKLTIPNGLSRYPYNGLWFVLLSIASISVLIIFAWASVYFENK